MKIPEYLLLFSNNGPYRVTVKFEKNSGSVGDRNFTPQEIVSLIAPATGDFFAAMEFDGYMFEIYRYEIDPIKKVLAIRARLN